jgi:hypothetical protein
VHQKPRQSSTVTQSAESQLQPPDDRVNSLTARSLDSAISSTTAEDGAATSRSIDEDGARARAPDIRYGDSFLGHTREVFHVIV